MTDLDELGPDDREAILSGSPAGVRALAGLSERLDDENLAELIERHAEARLSSSLSVSLGMYLESIPLLRERPNALDAALEAVMRSIAESSEISVEIIEKLIGQYPDLKEAILESASLTNSVLSASALERELQRFSSGELPRDFGVRLADGSSRYQLRRVLGAGASGQVFLAVDRQLSDDEHEAMVALKLFRATTVDERVQRSLLDEALKMRRVEHPNVVRVLDAGCMDEEGAFIVAEYASGGSLDQRLRAAEAVMPCRQAVEIVRRIALGLQAMHNAGVLHCDLKPSNIVMCDAGEPKIVDFGIAVRLPEARSQGDERADQPMGNIAFMAPERFQMAPNSLTIRADLYSLGGLLFHLLTGALPNGATIDSARAFLAGTEERALAQDPLSSRSGIDRDLAAICRRAMARDPAKRHESAAAIADDLRDWLARRPISWTKPGLPRRTFLWIRRRPAFAATLVIATSIAFGALAFANDAAVKRRESIMQARIEHAVRAQNDEAQRRTIRAIVFLLQSIGGGSDKTRILPSLSVMESLYGNEYLDVYGVEFFWELRVPHFRNIVTRATEDWGEDDLRTLMWELGHAMSLYRSGAVGEAGEVLDRNERAWVRLLDADDPWVRTIGRVRAAAIAKAILAGERPFTIHERRTLEDSAALLAEALDEAEKLAELTDAERIPLEVLAEIRATKPLRNPEVVKRAQALLDR